MDVPHPGGAEAWGPRVVLATNAGSFTLDGTRTFLLGTDRVVILDPGPEAPAHLERLAEAVASAAEGAIVLTHGHPDHAGGARALARRTGFPIHAPLPGGDVRLTEGARIPVDDGTLVAISTPGHAPEHMAFLHLPAGEGRTSPDSGPPEGSAELTASLPSGHDLFVGDLLLGSGDTTWVGGYPGCVADYLASLDRVDRLGPRRLLPAHGPVLDDPRAAVARIRAHRLARVAQVRRAWEGLIRDRAKAPPLPPLELAGALLDHVYDRPLDPRARDGARWSVLACLEHLGIAAFPAAEAPAARHARLAPDSGDVVSSE